METIRNFYEDKKKMVFGRGYYNNLEVILLYILGAIGWYL
jgi:hypothetical protein